MKNNFFLLLFLFPVLLFSQNKNSFQFVFSPDYNYRTLSGPESQQWAIDLLNESDQAKINFRFGLDYNHQLGVSSFLKTGIRFVKLGYYSRKGELRWPDMTTGYGEFSTNDRFIEIPINFRQEFNNTKMNPFFELGLSPMIYINSVSVVNLDGEVTRTPLNKNDSNLAEYNKLQLALNLSIGSNINFKKYYQFFYAPTFRYHLTKSFDSVNSEHLFNLGFDLGIRRFLSQQEKAKT